MWSCQNAHRRESYKYSFRLVFWCPDELCCNVLWVLMEIYGWIHISHTSTYDLDQGACYTYDLIDKTCWQLCTHIWRIVIYLWHTWLLAQTALVKRGRFVSYVHVIFFSKKVKVLFIFSELNSMSCSYFWNTMPELRIMINRTAPTSQLLIYSFMILPCDLTTVSIIRML